MQSIDLVRDNLMKSRDRVLSRVEEMRDHCLVFPKPKGGSHTLWVLGHLAYIEAGARVIETNTFAANRNKLRAFGLQDGVEEINGAAVKIARRAREVSGQEVLIAGSIGPSALPFDPSDGESEETLRDIFREQARTLDARGVDLFILETFVSLPEIRIAFEAVREVSQLPIVASVTFPGDAWEDKEDTGWPEKVARRLEPPLLDVLHPQPGTSPELRDPFLECLLNRKHKLGIETVEMLRLLPSFVQLTKSDLFWSDHPETGIEPRDPGGERSQCQSHQYSISQ
jgi:hypothetical protein